MPELPEVEEPEFSLDGYPDTVVRDEDGAILYAVKQGNTIIEIALIYGLTLEEIYALNGLNENSLLSVGQEIIVAYVPTPSADLVGGSADLPIQPDTPTPPPTVAPPTPLPTVTTQVIPTLAPPTPTAAVISALPTAVITVTPNPDDDPLTAAESNSEPLDSRFLGLLVGAIVIMLISLGLFFVYLGRRA